MYYWRCRVRPNAAFDTALSGELGVKHGRIDCKANSSNDKQAERKSKHLSCTGGRTVTGLAVASIDRDLTQRTVGTVGHQFNEIKDNEFL